MRKRSGRSSWESYQKFKAKRREWIASLKDHPCKDCKHRFPPECMDFDHVRGKKLFGIGTGGNGHPSRERVLEEIKKCELVCANCHRIRTKKRANYGKGR